MDYRWDINLRITLDGPEAKKDAVMAALRTMADDALAAGNIDIAEASASGRPIPEGWTVK